VAFGMEISEYRLAPVVGTHPVAGEKTLESGSRDELDWMDVQEPDDLAAGLAAAQCDDVCTDAVVKRSAPVLLSLRRNHEMNVVKIK
jgi:hypothetical protein